MKGSLPPGEWLLFLLLLCYCNILSQKKIAHNGDNYTNKLFNIIYLDDNK
jgi:hypothetical protein